VEYLMMHSCCCIWFILRCGFSFIWFEFKIHFKMALENKFIKEKKKEKETLPVQPAAWKPTRAGLLLPFLAVGPSEPSSFLRSLSCPRGPAQGAAVAARFPSWSRWRTGPTCRLRPSSLCRNRAGHELDLHRIKLDFPRILTQVEVSQPHIS
jgi:hypothetical protein